MYVSLENERLKGTWTVNVLIYSLQMNRIEDFVSNLQKFIRENYEEVAIEIVQNQSTFTEKVSVKSYDVVYYDISERGSKEDVIRELEAFRLQSPECDILLMAETEEYAITGYRVHAYDYIVLSEKEEDLISSFVRIMREKYDRNSTIYSVRMKGVWRRLKLKDIVYMETNDHHVLFHMSNGQVYKKLANFNSLTPPVEGNRDLFQCHKSYVVNGRYIKGMIQNSFIMQDGKKISISKPNRKNARNFYSWCVINGYLDVEEETENKKRP